MSYLYYRLEQERRLKKERGESLILEKMSFEDYILDLSSRKPQDYAPSRYDYLFQKS